ncbi:hypothetical protein [Chitinophaga sancti]|uniref:Uncharacterized protein n=1 Tax=Chitinophaga sancti TaxID=1004 RepID=A0A1K1SUG3_9BACT|nr:hypothetical protein [Chitinophaga sancti]WQD60536.1 hypothetical protein U0033_21825 [Chitinophaga sancti]WQG87337.1 hypothetical protein SR876_20650 [Chitinophaga sancti]SFW87977.1 hypothetical protein SAMN05661012_06173 [Chitinophaga sancti]
MKYLVQVCISAALFCACKSSTSSPPATDSTTLAVSKPADGLTGLYTGDFNGKKIYITINYARNNHLAGYNVLLGLRRNVSGSYKTTKDGIDVILNEPGDHPFDGKFTIHLDAAGEKGSGQWVPLNNSKLAGKSFSVVKIIQTEGKGNGFEADYPLGGDHRDINFKSDGSAILNYYPQIDDSTFAQQMITVRGTWERKGDSLYVNWEKKGDQPTPATLYTITYEGENDTRFLTGVETADSIRYWVGP